MRVPQGGVHVGSAVRIDKKEVQDLPAVSQQQGGKRCPYLLLSV